MPVTCTHLDEIRDVGRGLNVCPQCVEIGSTWVHLRQCLSCGQTGCCSDSPNTHASKHADATGHPVMRSLEPDEDWMWCFPDEQQFRRARTGGFLVVDPFLETGLWYAHEAASQGQPLPDDPGYVNEDRFPLGEWVAWYRTRRADLDPEQVEALEGVPGWHWA
jgi:hypothetical protein